jgi:hypothetical protein
MERGSGAATAAGQWSVERQAVVPSGGSGPGTVTVVTDRLTELMQRPWPAARP